jgi:tRNA modification GTPase
MGKFIKSEAEHDTILALSTPPGRSAISVIRMSGPAAFSVASDTISFIESAEESPACAQKDFKRLFPQAKARLCNIMDQQQILDQALVIGFHAPASFTGEDLVEFHLHGNPFIIDAVLNLLSKRVIFAGPGEFSRRAVLNSKIDLAQAEGIHSLISANSEFAHALAMRSLGGQFSSKIDELRLRIINLLALMEVELDFSDEEIQVSSDEKIVAELNEYGKILEKWISSWKSGRLVNGANVVIVGAPNAGKSTLMNAMLGEERVIVDSSAGTTRDAVNQRCRFGSIDVNLWDTAGIRQTDNRIELVGIDHTNDLIKKADLIILLLSADCDSITSEVADLIRMAKIDKKSSSLSGKGSLLSEYHAPVLLVGTKSDLLVSTTSQSKIDQYEARFKQFYSNEINLNHTVSISENSSVDGLIELLEKTLIPDTNIESTELIISEFRHLELFKQARQSLKNAEDAVANCLDHSLLATDIRECVQSLGQVYGGFDIEEVLDSVFSKFCIGK